ncbi:MAG: flagellar protein FlhE [Glaciimonas sp.]|nr:flagellar protein FlhE [Glaciimonas sp.]
MIVRAFRYRVACLLCMLIAPLTNDVEAAPKNFVQSTAAMRLERFLGKSYKEQSSSNKARLHNGQIKGAWTGNAKTPSISQRGMTFESVQIKPIGLVTQNHEERKIRRVQWQYGFFSPTPSNLNAYLCNANRCVMLTGANGSTDRFNGDDANTNFMFAFRANGRGAMLPPIQGEKLQINVSFE